MLQSRMVAIVFSCILCVLVMMPQRATAGPRTVTLAAEQETALLYATEHANARQAGQKDAEGKSLPALTSDEVLAQIVAADLANVLRNMQVTASSLVKQLKVLDAVNQTKVLMTEPSPAVRALATSEAAKPVAQ